MSEAAPASAPTTVTPSAAPEATPTVTTEAAPAPVAAKAKVQTFAEYRASLTKPKAAPVAAPAKAPEGEAPPVETKPATAQIEMTDAELKAATELSKEARAARAKIKELEPAAAIASTHAESMALKAQGKHIEAAALMGFDYLEMFRQATADPSAAPAAFVEPVDPKLADLTKTVEEIKAAEAERKKREDADNAVKTKAATEADVSKVTKWVTDNAQHFPFLNRNPEWVREAYDEAAQHLPELVKQKGAPLSDEERSRLAIAALEEKEAEHATRAKLYAPTANPTLPNQVRDTPSKPSARPPVKQKTKTSFAEYRKQLRGE